MGSKKRSAVWMYFEKNEKGTDKSLCKICLATMQSTGGTTSNMFKHLRTRHPEEYAHVEEVRKMAPLASSKNQKTLNSKIKLSDEESEKPAAVRSPQVKREVRILYEDQEVKVLMPFLKNEPHGNQQRSTAMNGHALQTEFELEVQPGPENHVAFDQSHATELPMVDDSGNDAISGADEEVVYVARKNNEWQDLFHESLRPHLRDMNRQQQRQYISRVSQVVMEILNP